MLLTPEGAAALANEYLLARRLLQQLELTLWRPSHGHFVEAIQQHRCYSKWGTIEQSRKDLDSEVKELKHQARVHLDSRWQSALQTHSASSRPADLSALQQQWNTQSWPESFDDFFCAELSALLDTQVALHRLHEPPPEASPQQINLARLANAEFAFALPLMADAELYERAQLCFQKQKHYCCVICRRRIGSGIQVKNSHIVPHFMVKDDGVQQYNFLLNKRKTAETLVYTGFCNDCEQLLGFIGESDASVPYKRLQSDFHSAWSLSVAEAKKMWMCIYSIAWRSEAVSGRLAHDATRQKQLQEGRMFLQYQHLENGPPTPGNVLIACHVPNRTDVDGSQGIGIGHDLRKTYAVCETVQAAMGSLPVELQFIHLGPLHVAYALLNPILGKQLIIKELGDWHALFPDTAFSIPNSDVRKSNVLLKEHLFQLLQTVHQKVKAIEEQ